MKFPRLFLIALLLALAPLARGQTLEVLHYFVGDEGAYPEGGLVQARDGNFYGTTVVGGPNSGHGTVFRMETDTTITTLFSFDGFTNGGHVHTGLMQASDGNLYGATLTSSVGPGTLFKITTNGVLTTLSYSFPWKLVESSNGDFYGTTFYQNGTVFRMTSNGVITTLLSFNGTNGSTPMACLVAGSDGDFYGTTDQGGASNLGTVFRITTNGVLTTLVSFNGTNGANPRAELVQGSNGDFYGTTYTGGTNNFGTVFKITANGLLTSLVSFTSTNGASHAGLIQASDGNFYGTTRGYYFDDEDLEGHGTVFQMTANGTLTTLFSFDGTNGATPYATLIEGNDGNLYGTTRSGNLAGDWFLGGGTIYRIIMPVSLNSRVSGNELVLSWPTNALGFTLQAAADLNSPINWIDSTNAPAVVGAQFTVTNNLSASAQFYRLKKP